MARSIYRAPAALAYGVGLLLGYSTQIVSGTLQTVTYAAVIVCAILLVAGDVTADTDE